MKKKRLTIVGFGRFGPQVGRFFVENGFAVQGLTRSPVAIGLPAQLQVHASSIEQMSCVELESFCESDLLLVCLPAKAGIQVFDLVAKAASKAKHIILISSTSVYGSRNGVVSESDTLPATMEPRATRQWEIESLFAKIDRRVTVLRSGGLLGSGLHPGKFLPTASLQVNTFSPVNLVNMADLARAAVHIERAGLVGVYNCVYPDHPSRLEYYTAAALSIGLMSPSFDLAAELDTGKTVSSAKLLQTGFEFKYPIDNWQGMTTY